MAVWDKMKLRPATSTWTIIAILLIALALRLHGLSQGIGYHPDERHIVGVTNDLTWADPNPHFFAYGSLPFYVTWGISEVAGFFRKDLKTYDGLFYIGRVLSICGGLLAIWMTWLLSLRLFRDRRGAALAALLLALNVFHLQLSRFYTVDVLLGALSLAVLLTCVRAIDTRSWRLLLCAGVLTGASVATKIGALTLFLPLGLSWVAIALTNERFRGIVFSRKTFFIALLVALPTAFLLFMAYVYLSSYLLVHDTTVNTSIVTSAKVLGPLGLVLLLIIAGGIFAISCRPSWSRRPILQGFATVVLALLTFIFCEPYAILDFQKFLANNQEQIRMVMGEWRPPYTIQYERTTPYLYHLQQIAQYTMGWPLALYPERNS